LCSRAVAALGITARAAKVSAAISTAVLSANHERGNSSLSVRARVRGLDNVNGEWSLVTMAWNVKRMFALKAA